MKDIHVFRNNLFPESILSNTHRDLRKTSLSCTSNLVVIYNV